MFLIRFIRFLRGYVVFTCTGGFPERFINLCSLNGINLWDAKSSNGVLTAKTTISCYKHIRPCARKSGMKIKIRKKHGLPFLIQPYVKRKGIAVGLIISAVILIFLYSGIWTIEVTGNEKFTEEQILSIAESYGIYPSAFRNKINPKEIQTDIKSKIKGISWFSVNIDNSHISLEVSESTGSDVIIDYTTPCNIVSGIDGEILSIEAHTGVSVVKPGSAVTIGDLLISGVMEKNDGSPYFVHARGTAVIRRNRNISAEIPYNITAKKISDIKTRHSVSIYGLDVPLGVRKTADFENSKKLMLSYRNKTLPVGILKDCYYFLNEEKITLSENQATLLACLSAFLQEMNIMNNAETEKKEVKAIKKDKAIAFSADYINHETTGIENYFEIINE